MGDTLDYLESISHCLGAPLDLLPPLLWCGEWQVLFDYSGGLEDVKLDDILVSAGATGNIFSRLFK